MAIVEDTRTAELRCTECPCKDDIISSHAMMLAQMGAELAHSKEAHEQTQKRKSALFQDWLADRRTIWLLRCQLREANIEPAC